MTKKEKKVKTKYEKRKLIMNIAAWAMAITMIIGVIMSFLMYFI